MPDFPGIMLKIMRCVPKNLFGEPEELACGPEDGPDVPEGERITPAREWLSPH